MTETERLDITLPVQMAADVKQAVDSGDYASSSEVVHEALRDWTAKRAEKRHELEALKADIEQGSADLEAGRVRDFDAARIAERGKRLSNGRSRSA